MIEYKNIEIVISAYLCDNLSDDALPEIRELLHAQHKLNKTVLRSRLKVVFGAGGSIGARLGLYPDKKRKILEILLSLNDSILERQICKSIFTKKSLDFIGLYLEIKTGIFVDLTNKSTLTPEHIKIINLNIPLFGLSEIYYGLSLNGVLVNLCKLDALIARKVEDHIIKKSNQYKKFYNLPKFVRNFPECNKKRIYLFLIKLSHLYGAAYAISQLDQDPELKKYSILK